MRTIMLCLALGLFAIPALANPMISETKQFYPLTATTLNGLKREFRSKGPKGFAGLTRWEVRWNAACQVEVQVTYTLPKHSDPDAIPPKLRQKLDAMMRALERHERLHGADEIKAGQEIRAAGCNKPRAIIRKYSRADRELDRLTRNGRTQGVSLGPRTRDRKPASR